MDVVDLVKRDHDRVEELFRRFNGGGGLTGLVRRVTGTVSPRQRKTAVTALCRELDTHAQLEEEILYPAIRATGDTELGRMVDEAFHEHARVKDMVAELRQGRHAGEELDAKMSSLEDSVSHHVREEEDEMLPRVQSVIDERERARLAQRMQVRRRRVLGRGATLRAGRRAAARRGRAKTTARSRQKKSARRARS
jgi:iron-sulfur cluster repair protein YtfE (RIC family)